MKHNFLFGAMLFTACVFSANVKADLTVETSGDVKIDKNITVSGTTNASKIESSTINATTVNATTTQTKDLTVTGTLKAASLQFDSYQVPSLSIGGAAQSGAKLTIKGTGVGAAEQYGLYSYLSYGTSSSPAIAVFGHSTGLHAQLIGVKGSATGNSTRNTAPACGVYGIAGGNTGGKNYGVFGVVSNNGSVKGAGVYGSIDSDPQVVPG